ncbi:MAG: hypothetical protein LBQ79_10640 [Deltaproteobacteria bacterium]|jgi:hypothetical protein|nr:hypothetical protein [Deltaproteobacteria bacterium]
MKDFTQPWTPPVPEPPVLTFQVLIRASFRLTAERFPALLMFSLAVAVFMILPRAANIAGASTLSVLLSCLSVISLLAALGAAAACTLSSRKGTRASAIQCLLTAATALPQLSLLGILVFAVYAVLLVLVLGIGMGMWMEPHATNAMLAVPMADVALAAFLAGQFSLAAPVCVLEGKGAFPAMARSFSLLRGSRLGVFLVYLILLASNVAASFLTLKMLQAGKSQAVAFGAEFAASLVLSFPAIAVTGTLYRLKTDAKAP